MREMVERPREIIARVHAERDVRWKELGSGDIADTIMAELAVCGFVIVPRVPTEAMVSNALPEGLWWDDASPNGVWQAMIDEALK